MKNNYKVVDDKCYIELTQGKECIIDVEDMELVGQYRWFAHKNKNTYSVGTNKSRFFKKHRQIKIHRLIMGLKPGDRKEIDHRDHNPFNNCKDNLRICTSQENKQNKKSNKKATSKFKGVSWYKQNNKWRACIMLNKKFKHIGLFEDEIEAAKAYDKKAVELFGEFAYLNFKEKEYA